MNKPEDPMNSKTTRRTFLKSTVTATGAVVGLHRRSSKLYKSVAQMVQSGKIGKVTIARAFRISNMYPYGIGVYPTVQPPKTLDWDMWLGPRSLQPIQHNIPLYKFRWWQNYSSQMGNWGVHYCDASSWVLNEKAPVSISAHGGQFAIKDDRTIPDTMQVIFEFASGKLLTFGQYEACGGQAILTGEIEFRGTLGNLYTGKNGEFFKILPTEAGQFQENISTVREITEIAKSDDPNVSMNTNLTQLHIRNFLDCIKS
jgi:predicted dehydrogenase